jgi:hypothetical protein
MRLFMEINDVLVTASTSRGQEDHWSSTTFTCQFLVGTEDGRLASFGALGQSYNKAACSLTVDVVVKQDFDSPNGTEPK